MFKFVSVLNKSPAAMRQLFLVVLCFCSSVSRAVSF